MPLSFNLRSSVLGLIFPFFAGRPIFDFGVVKSSNNVPYLNISFKSQFEEKNYLQIAVNYLHFLRQSLIKKVKKCYEH